MTARRTRDAGTGSATGPHSDGFRTPHPVDVRDPHGPYGPYGPRDPYWRARSALVLPAPAVGTVVDRHRWRMDPSAARGLGAHVDLVSPSVAPDAVTPDTLARLEETFRPVPAFDATFDQVRWFDDADGLDDQAIWLAPVPEEPFLDLMRRARDAAGLPDADHPPVPHLIVGYRRHASLDEMRIAAYQLGPQLPVTATLDRVALVVTDGAVARWDTLACFPLGG